MKRLVWTIMLLSMCVIWRGFLPDVCGQTNVSTSPPYDIVLANGRVIDPETKLDAVRNVGIKDGKIAAVSPDALKGQVVVDATGLIVAPGFIDWHEEGRLETGPNGSGDHAVATCGSPKFQPALESTT